MSAEINNREYRQGVLKNIIGELHSGKGVDEVKARFEETFGGVSAEEITQAEQALIDGGLPVEEVQRLCDVHAAVFKGSIADIHAAHDPSDIPGHPVSSLKLENRAIEKLIADIRAELALLPDNAAHHRALQGIDTLAPQIEKHYLKKENLIFPYMERYGITAPPKVMWGVDDEIRAQLKGAKNAPDFAKAAEEALQKAIDMIFKEENIMLPMLSENLTQAEWKYIADEMGELGWCLIDPPPVWKPVEQSAQSAAAPIAGGDIVLPTGVLKLSELTHLLDTLPIDITFVDKDETVKYFSQGAERVFPRTKAVIGRKVANCHPPASVHVVEKIVEDLKAGRKDHEDFWIKMGGKYILIRYFAVRDEQGDFLGVLEVTQNIQPIQAISGEKRLVSE